MFTVDPTPYVDRHVDLFPNFWWVLLVALIICIPWALWSEVRKHRPPRDVPAPPKPTRPHVTVRSRVVRGGLGVRARVTRSDDEAR